MQRLSKDSGAPMPVVDILMQHMQQVHMHLPCSVQPHALLHVRLVGKLPEKCILQSTMQMLLVCIHPSHSVCCTQVKDMGGGSLDWSAAALATRKEAGLSVSPPLQ